jgi:class 3 adenylate cyclase
MTRMQPVIHANGGFINQFVGDEIMAIFYKSGHSEDAFQTAIAMRKVLQEHNHERSQRGEPPIDIGVGINTGKVIWGTIGSEVRMESAIIGDTVNLASRLQSLTKHYGTGVLAAESAYRQIPNPEKYRCRPVDVVQVKGKTQPGFLITIPSRSSNKKPKACVITNKLCNVFAPGIGNSRQLYLQRVWKLPHKIRYRACI